MNPHHRSSLQPSRFLRVLLSESLLLAGLLAGSQAQGQTAIIPDGTLGTTVTQTGTVSTIAGGTLQGPNQFHSFDRFRVGSGDTARFTGPAGIANILSRVTGGQQSVIDGQVQSTIPGANLYLLNPAGVVFGPTASLDVKGSFHVSTADYLRFADGTTFVAHLGAQSFLTVAPPAAFGFLGPNPNGIAVRGSSLSVQPGNSLSLVGGDIEIVGGRPPATDPPAPPNVAAPGGRITIASVASGGEVGVPAAEQTPVLDMGAFARLGTITLRDNARLEASGTRGGTVVIRGGRLSMDGGQIVANRGEEPGASPGIDMQITDAAVFTNKALLTTEAGGTGKAGDIHLTANQVEVHEVRVGSVARHASSGSAGNVTITAGSVLVTGENARVESLAQDNTSGDAGRVTITANTLTVEHGAEVRASTGGTGSAGTVAIQVGQLTLRDGGRIEANVSTGGTGNGSPGSITVRATDHVTIDGANNTETGLVSRTSGSSRAAGTITVETGRLEITGGGQVATNTSGSGGDAGTVQITAQEVTLAGRGSQLTSTAAGSGNAGHVSLEVGRLTVTDGAQIDTGTAPGSRGQAGTITIRATDAVTLASTDVVEARLISRAAGSGNGGQITIATPRLAVASGGRISAIARDGQDGRIDVTAVGSLMLAGGLVDRLNEIHLDGSLAPSRPLEGADITIGAELGQIHGANLFHSFSRFRLLPGGTVTFTGPSQVTTILSRVTGAEPALIEGTLRSDIPGASLFFLAPRGVLFGAGARLALTGAVHVSTADALRLDDGGRLGGSGTEASLLTAGRPVAFGFATLAPAPITLRLEQWPLTVRGGTRLSLVGGDITLATGALQAPGIPVHLVSVGAPGEVLFTPSGDAQAFQVTGFSQGGRLTFSERTRLTTQEDGGDAGPIAMQAAHVTLQRDAEVSADASRTGHGGRMTITADTLTVADGRLAAATQGPGNAGEIVIRAGRLDVTEGGLIAAAQDIPADAPADVQGSGQGGRIQITATAVHVGGRNPAEQPSRIEGSTDGSGAGGAIDLQVHTLAVTDGGFISTGSNRRATGAGGLLRVTATGDVTIAGSGELRSRTFGRGRGGDIEVRAARVLVMDGGRIDTRTVGTDPEGDNAAGAILINTGRLEVTGGGRISSASEEFLRGVMPTGAAGTVRVVAPEVRLAGQGSQLTSATARTGRGGNVVVETGTLTLLGGARLDSRTRGGGPGGTVTVTATDAVTVAEPGSGLFTETAGQGPGGDIVLHTRVGQLTDGATISAQSAGAGNAGNVRIGAAETLLLSSGSTVTTGATRAKGGNIMITAQRLVRLRNSQITTAVGSGEGAGGNITIDPEFVLLENSQISANAVGGPGGDVTIRAGVFLADPASRVTATSERSVAGEIAIQAPVTNLSGLVTPILPDFAPVGELLHDPCVERLRKGTVSSFVVRGRASLPVTYDSILPSRLYEPQQPQTPAIGVGHPPQETAVSSQALSGSAAIFSSRRLDLRCVRP